MASRHALGAAAGLVASVLAGVGLAAFGFYAGFNVWLVGLGAGALCGAAVLHYTGKLRDLATQGIAIACALAAVLVARLVGEGLAARAVARARPQPFSWPGFLRDSLSDPAWLATFDLPDLFAAGLAGLGAWALVRPRRGADAGT